MAWERGSTPRLAVSHLQGDIYRIVALVDDDTPARDLSGVQRMLDARGPSAAGAVVSELGVLNTWRVRHRLADPFRKRAGHRAVGQLVVVRPEFAADPVPAGLSSWSETPPAYTARSEPRG
nr:hypothetical protein [Streptomyces sp. SID5914]